jgi:chromosome segregation ATPase
LLDCWPVLIIGSHTVVIQASEPLPKFIAISAELEKLETRVKCNAKANALITMFLLSDCLDVEHKPISQIPEFAKSKKKAMAAEDRRVEAPDEASEALSALQRTAEKLLSERDAALERASSLETELARTRAHARSLQEHYNASEEARRAAQSDADAARAELNAGFDALKELSEAKDAHRREQEAIRDARCALLMSLR